MRALPPGMDERRNKLAGRTDLPTERPEREGACAGSHSEPARRWQQREREQARPPSTRTGCCLGLTNSSSATEAGEDRLNHGTDSTASLCSLERVVRLPAYRGASGPPELKTWTPAGE